MEQYSMLDDRIHWRTAEQQRQQQSPIDLDEAAEEPRLDDKWLWASSMQKAIRLGDERAALSACRRLLAVDRGMALNRLAIIAAEDVGAGNPIACLDLLGTAIRKADLEERFGSREQAAMFYARAFSASDKDRSACNLMGLAQSAPLESWRKAASLPAAELLARADLEASAPSNPIAWAMAAWLSASPKRIAPPVQFHDEGFASNDSFKACCSGLGLTKQAIEDCLMCLPYCSEWHWIGLPYCLAAPTRQARQDPKGDRLLELSFQAGFAGACGAAPARPPIQAHGVLLQALDGHTRDGASLLASHVASTAVLRKALAGALDQSKARKHLLFWAEGHQCANSIDNWLSRRLASRALGSLARELGGSTEAMLEAIGAMVESLPQLDARRLELLDAKFKQKPKPFAKTNK